MGLRLKIEGSESIDLKETSITNVKFGADIPMIPMPDRQI